MISNNIIHKNSIFNKFLSFTGLIIQTSYKYNLYNFKEFYLNNLHFYVNYINKYDKYLDKNIFSVPIDFVVCSTPRCQPYFVIFKNKPKFIISGGLVRRILQFSEKCAKKNRLVLVNCIAILYKLINNFLKNTFFIKIKKNLVNLRFILDKKYIRPKSISYILIEPGLNFGTQNVKKRSAIKKRLKKKKKIIND